ncbi:hypothetical protein [Rheinheimera texasensis]|uniref:hypothetical protein n=1 Tax=Rheinheimera texasensis TaxID=306205 RepID=UPI0032B24D3B
MWKWMSMLVLLVVAILWFWPEDQPLPAKQRNFAADSQNLMSSPASPAAVEAEQQEVAATATSALSAVQSCPAPKQLAEQLTTLRASRQHQSEELKRLMQEAQLRPELQLQYLRELGGDIAVLRPQGRQTQDGSGLLIQQHQQLVTIAASDLAQVKLATQQHDYRALQDWLQQYPQPADIAKLGYLELTLLQIILQKDPELQPVQLQQLLDSGFRAGFLDLLLVSRAGRDLQIVDMLQQSYGGELAISWLENQRLMNLTLLAAERADTTLFDYWLAQGVPAGFGPPDDNAFDLLPLPASQAELQQQLPLVRTLLRLQLAPGSAERQWFWLQQLPEAEATQLRTLLQHEPLGADPLGTTASATVSRELRQTSQQISQTLMQLWQCQGQSQLPAIITESAPDSALQQILQVNDKILNRVRTDADEVALVRKFEQTTTQMQQYIRQANWQGLDAFMQTQVKDRNSVYFNNRSFAQEFMLHQMLQLQAPPAEIVKRLKFFGDKLPPAVITLIQYSQDPELAPALQKAGYRIPALVVPRQKAKE